MKIRKIRNLFPFVMLLLYQLSATAQADLKQIAPLTPNAAAIAKYGEVPIGHFTGVPNISIPIWVVKSGELELPLSLSYHAGGNKVEDVASWVGMGWSISGIPSLSRNVRGLPDEAGVGTFSKFDNKSTKQIAQEYQVAANAPDWVFNYSMNIIQGNLDTETDMYQFSLPGRSGRFYWDQVAGKYQTNPWSNIKIQGDLNLGEFTITDENGVIYKFGFIETSQTQGFGTSPEIKTSWQISKMYNANRTDSISFGYSPETQSVMSINPTNRVYWGGCPPSGSYTSTQTLKAYTPYSISFKNGNIEFTKDLAARQDLVGGYALKSIQVNNNQGLVKKFLLAYDYRTADASDPQCNLLSASAAEKKRLMLRTFAEQANDNSQSLTHYFLYDSTISSPCRVGTAQDFWGYYNGANSNQDIVAMGPVSVAGSIQFPSGANRYVNSNFSQYGILKRIVYPTGGYSDFTYENNEAYTSWIPRKYTAKTAYLAAEGTISGSVYIDTFTVSNPADFYLNGNSSGSFSKIVFGDLGYDHSQGMQQAGLLYLKGIDPSNSNINTTISYNLDGYLLPNGRYEMKAVFNQDPPLYENFYYIITWNEIEPGSINQFVGGLRLKELASHDGLGGILKKQYRYTESLSSDTSSGDIFGTAAFLRNEYSICTEKIGNSVAEYYNYYFTAAGNATAVNHSGSFVGYKSVYESVDNLLTLGVTEYKFSHARDGFVSHEDPFPPTFSMQEFRGQPTRITHFKKQGNALWPVSRTVNEYHHKEFDSLAITNLKTRVVRYPVYDGTELVTDAPPILKFAPYEEFPVWSSLKKKTEYSFDPNDTTKFLQQVTDYEYSPTHYQLVKTKITNSKQQQLEVKQFYPQDLTLSGDHEAARIGLINRNKISAVLKTEQTNGSTHVSTIESRYKTFSPNSMILPDEIWQRIGNATVEPRVKFLSYDASGNLTSQQKTGDVVQSYIWGYGNTYPIAQAVNAAADRIAYTSFESAEYGGWSLNSGSVLIDYSNAKTGSRTVSGGVNKSIPQGDYVISFWSIANTWLNGQLVNETPLKIEGEWRYFEIRLSNVTSVHVTGDHIDEVRLYPVGAQMETYTYIPLLGLSTNCDGNSRISSYEYDGLGRLKIVRDENKNVIKRFDYQYQKNTNQ